MSLETKMISLVQAIGTDIKTINSEILKIPNFEISSTSVNDVLILDANGKWKNKPQETVTDGGNF